MQVDPALRPAGPNIGTVTGPRHRRQRAVMPQIVSEAAKPTGGSGESVILAALRIPDDWSLPGRRSIREHVPPEEALWDYYNSQGLHPEAAPVRPRSAWANFPQSRLFEAAALPEPEPITPTTGRGSPPSSSPAKRSWWPGPPGRCSGSSASHQRGCGGNSGTGPDRGSWRSIPRRCGPRRWRGMWRRWRPGGGDLPVCGPPGTEHGDRGDRARSGSAYKRVCRTVQHPTSSSPRGHGGEAGPFHLACSIALWGCPRSGPPDSAPAGLPSPSRHPGGRRAHGLPRHRRPAVGPFTSSGSPGTPASYTHPPERRWAGAGASGSPSLSWRREVDARFQDLVALPMPSPLLRGGGQLGIASPVASAGPTWSGGWAPAWKRVWSSTGGSCRSHGTGPSYRRRLRPPWSPQLTRGCLPWLTRRTAGGVRPLPHL